MGTDMTLTKTDLKEIRSLVNKEIKQNNTKIFTRMTDLFVTRKEFDYKLQSLATKDDIALVRNELGDIKEYFIKMHKEYEEEFPLLRHIVLDDRKRIEKIEEKLIASGR